MASGIKTLRWFKTTTNSKQIKIQAGRPLKLAQLNVGEGEPGNGIKNQNIALNQNNNKQQKEKTNSSS